MKFQATIPIIVYSDAEGIDFNIGLVAWDPLDPTRVHSAAGTCPPWLLQHTLSMCPDARDADDGLINAVALAGALVLFTTFPDMLRGRHIGRRILMYQDNLMVFHCAVPATATSRGPSRGSSIPPCRFGSRYRVVG